MWLVDSDNPVDACAAFHFQQYTKISVRVSTVKCGISINLSDVKQLLGYGFLTPQTHASVIKISVHIDSSQAIGYFMTSCDQSKEARSQTEYHYIYNQTHPIVCNKPHSQNYNQEHA